jgi:predicted transcriptional regulator
MNFEKNSPTRIYKIECSFATALLAVARQSDCEVQGRLASSRIHLAHDTIYYVTRTATRIIELFHTLPERDQRALAEQLMETARGASFYSRMSPQQRAELEEGLSEAERGETIPAEESFDDLAMRFGFRDA